MKAAVLVMLAACTSAPAVPSNDGLVWLHAYSFHTTNTWPTTGGNAWISFETQHTTCHAVESSGACDLIECPGEPTILGPHRAGTVTVTGAVMPISMTPNEEGLYGGMDSPRQALFAGGATLTVTATGDEVPAFTASLTAPSKAAITSPARPANDAIVIERLAGLPVSWTGGSGTLDVTVSPLHGDLRSVECSFDASAGNGIIPADLLWLLPAGDAYISFGTESESRFSAGDWDIAFRGVYNAVWSDDSPIDGTATLR